MTECSQCGAPNATDARFCNQCGQPIVLASTPGQRTQYTPAHLTERVLKHRSAIEGERKQVTVVFADMVGSTRLAEQVDAEDWHHILDEFFGILGAEIHRYEGTINQYTGDGIMALFGAPVAHEDHARRAMLAALALQERLREFSDRLRLEQGINLSTRMGINSGEVVVGSIGDDLRMDYTAQGLTVNLAARMEQIAEPGRVYLTRDTADLVEDYFQLRALGPMAVKGREAPVQVFELVGQSAVSLRLEAARLRGLTDFAGRDHELEALQNAQKHAQESAGGLFVIVGDAGLGKSRLCFEAIERWQQKGLRVLQTSGLPSGTAAPAEPVRQLLRQRFGIHAEDGAKTTRQKLAGELLLGSTDLREELPLLFDFMGVADPASPVLELPPDARDRRLMELYRQLCQFEKQQPDVILIEDLQWVSEAAQEFFKVIVECARCSRALVVFNSRPGGLPAWLQAYQPEILELQPLSVAGMQSMSRSLLGDAPALDALAARISQQAAGNPFFIEETVRALVAAGVLQGEPGQYRAVGDLSAVTVPASVQALIAGRVDSLDGEDKAVLQAAAVLGGRFEFRLLEALMELPGTALQRRFERLALGNYLRRDSNNSDDDIVFCHPLYQEVVYSSLLSDKRRATHERVARLLEKHLEQYPDCIKALIRVSHHWAEAGNGLRAARWSLDAAVVLVRDNVVEQVRMMRQAIAQLQQAPKGMERDSLAIRARAGLIRASSFYPLDDAEMSALYQEGRDLAGQDSHPLELAELLISNGVRLQNRAHADEAMANTAEAMRIVQERGADSLQQRFRIPILFSHFAAGMLCEGLEVLDRTDNGAWHRGAITNDTVYSRGFRAYMLAHCGHIDTAMAEATAAIAYAEEQELAVSWMRANLVDIKLMQGDSEGLLQLAEQSVEQAELFGSPLFLEIALRAQAQALVAYGQGVKARDLLIEALPLVAEGAVAQQFSAAHRVVLAQSWQQIGEPEAAYQEVQRAIQAGEHARQRIWVLRAKLLEAELMLGLGKEMHDRFEPIEALIALTGARYFEAECLLTRARWSQRLEQTDQACAQHRLGLRKLREFGADGLADQCQDFLS